MTLCLPLNVICAPRNFSWESMMDTISWSDKWKLAIFDEPYDIDNDLHLDGSRVRFMDLAKYSIFEMMRWCDLALDVITLKSIAKGVEIIGVFLFNVGILNQVNW